VRVGGEQLAILAGEVSLLALRVATACCVRGTRAGVATC
jgi:hypothetical protein